MKIPDQLADAVRQIRRCWIPVAFSIVVAVLLAQAGWFGLVVLAIALAATFYLGGYTVRITKKERSHED